MNPHNRRRFRNWCFASIEQDGQPVSKEHVREGNEGIGRPPAETWPRMYGMRTGESAHSVRTATRGRKCRVSDPGVRIQGCSSKSSPGICPMRTTCLTVPAGPQRGEVGPYLVGQALKPAGSRARTTSQRQPRSLPRLDRCVREHCLPECNVLEGRMTVEMIGSVFASHLGGGPVKIPLKNSEGNPLSFLIDGEDWWWCGVMPRCLETTVAPFLESAPAQHRGPGRAADSKIIQSIPAATTTRSYNSD